MGLIGVTKQTTRVGLPPITASTTTTTATATITTTMVIPALPGLCECTWCLLGDLFGHSSPGEPLVAVREGVSKLGRVKWGINKVAQAVRIAKLNTPTIKRHW